MALTARQMELRDGKLTASQVSALMTGDAAKILNLWRFHIGDPAYVEEDLSGVWPVRLGEVTEELNLAWYARKHGGIGRMGEVVDGPEPWMAATLDGWSLEGEFPVEAKHVGGREPLETIVARYMPQLHWQMLCTGAKKAALTVIMGANEPVVEYVEFDETYAAELMRRARDFMWHVENLSPPVELPAVPAPVVAAKEYDMSENETWFRYAGTWLQAVGAAVTAKEAEKAIKAIVPTDAVKAVGCGIVVTRNRAGALSLRESKQ